MHPVLLHLPFGVPLYGYGTMLLLAMLAGGLVAVRLGERDGIARDLTIPSIAWTILCAVIGSRLLFVVLNAGRLESFLEVFQIWRGGVVAYGGFLGGVTGAAMLVVNGSRSDLGRLRRAGSVRRARDCARQCLLAKCISKPWDGHGR
jgi:prolipoprotein diacylglyceryltransferase